MSRIKVLIALPGKKETYTFFTEMVLEKMNEMDGFEFIWNPYDRHFTEEEKEEFIKGKDACILGWGCGKYSESILGTNPDLRFIGVLGGAINPYIDEDFFNREDRVIVNSADVMAKSVAEAVIAYMLASLRDIHYYDYFLKHVSSWRSNDFHNEGLFNKTIGLIGLGRVGRYLIEFLRPFNINFLLYDPYINPLRIEYENVTVTDIETVITNSRIISIHAAYTKETHHLLNKELLSRIPDGALLVNTARGGIIDERALIEELKLKRFKAALDVFEEEPLPVDSELRKMDNVLLIPHMAGPTVDMRQYMALSVLEDLKKFFRGEAPLGMITRSQFKIMTLG